MNRILFLPGGASKYKTQILSYRLEAISELKVFSLFVLLLISLCWDIMQLTEFDMTVIFLIAMNGLLRKCK